MPLYEFIRLRDGQIVEEVFPMSAVPTAGSEVLIDGEKCQRIFSDHKSFARRVIHPFTSISLPQWEGKKEGWHKRYDEDPCSPEYGQPIFADRKEAEAFSDRSGGKWTFDGLPAACESRFRPSLKAMVESEKRAGHAIPETLQYEDPTETEEDML